MSGTASCSDTGSEPVPTGRRGGEDADGLNFSREVFDRLTGQDYVLTSQLGDVAEVG